VGLRFPAFVARPFKLAQKWGCNVRRYTLLCENPHKLLIIFQVLVNEKVSVNVVEGFE